MSVEPAVVRELRHEGADIGMHPPGVGKKDASILGRARMTLTGFGRFDLAYFRHTGRWFTVFRGLMAAQCFKELEGNEVFGPM